MGMKEHWEKQRKQCLATFGGGHHFDGKMDAFQHGMETVFNMLQGTNKYVLRSDLEQISEMLTMDKISRDDIREFISRTLGENFAALENRTPNKVCHRVGGAEKLLAMDGFA